MVHSRFELDIPVWEAHVRNEKDSLVACRLCVHAQCTQVGFNEEWIFLLTDPKEPL